MYKNFPLKYWAIVMWMTKTSWDCSYQVWGHTENSKICLWAEVVRECLIPLDLRDGMVLDRVQYWDDSWIMLES